jgi:hypothetical protein
MESVGAMLDQLDRIAIPAGVLLQACAVRLLVRQTRFMRAADVRARAAAAAAETSSETRNRAVAPPWQLVNRQGGDR